MSLLNTYNNILTEAILKEDDSLGKLMQLIETGDENNIDLALSIAESNNIPLIPHIQEIQKKAFENQNNIEKAIKLSLADDKLLLEILNNPVFKALNSSAHLNWESVKKTKRIELFSIALNRILNEMKNKIGIDGELTLYGRYQDIPAYILYNKSDNKAYQIIKYEGNEYRTDEIMEIFGAFHPELKILKNLGENIFTDGSIFYFTVKEDYGGDMILFSMSPRNDYVTVMAKSGIFGVNLTEENRHIQIFESKQISEEYFGVDDDELELNSDDFPPKAQEIYKKIKSSF